MDYLEAVKLTNSILKMLNMNDYRKIKQCKYEIEHYKYINTNIYFKDYINIGIKELTKNKYNFKQLEKDIKSYIGKKKRIKTRIQKMNPNNLWFATYTINDKSMNKDHIRKLRDLNKNNRYIINVDYGHKNSRKHYHGIIESENEPITWNYGFCKFIKVGNVNEQALAKYINKITNHAIKDTAEKIIYSRKKNNNKKI